MEHSINFIRKLYMQGIDVQKYVEIICQFRLIGSAFV